MPTRSPVRARQVLRPVPFAQAVEAWKRKVPVRPGDFKQLADEAKTLAFSVSGIAKGDELTTVFDSMTRAL
ncbi:MAG: hypothetical protein JRI97_12485, partial [Deltaproteobacteria bacterium]|nr:hypothetical protein [Deltaproteobacteria bacterium]